MIVGLFSIFDKKAAAYSPPFSAPTRGAAVRMFSDVASDPQSMVCKHPEDFQLVIVGDFNPDSGAVEGVKMEVLAEALTLKEASV